MWLVPPFVATCYTVVFYCGKIRNEHGQQLRDAKYIQVGNKKILLAHIKQINASSLIKLQFMIRIRPLERQDCSLRQSHGSKWKEKSAGMV